MKKNERRYKIGRVSYKLKFSSLLPFYAILFLVSCQTLPPPWTSPSLSLKVKGTLISPKRKIPWTTYVYMKGEKDLRADVITPLGGTVFRLLIKEQQITLQTPLKKSYCQFSDHKYKIGSKGPSLSITDLFLLLRDKTPKEWSCSPQSLLKPSQCVLPGENFKVSLKKSSRKKTLELKKDDTILLTLTMTPLSGSPLEEKDFSFNTQGWTRLDSCEKEFFKK